MAEMLAGAEWVDSFAKGHKVFPQHAGQVKIEFAADLRA